MMKAGLSDSANAAWLRCMHMHEQGTMRCCLSGGMHAKLWGGGVARRGKMPCLTPVRVMRGVIFTRNPHPGLKRDCCSHPRMQVALPRAACEPSDPNQNAWVGSRPFVGDWGWGWGRRYCTEARKGVNAIPTFLSGTAVSISAVAEVT